jgi:hypothetical protein
VLHTETAAQPRVRNVIAAKPPAVEAVRGWASTVRADGTYDTSAIMVLAHRRAAAEVALIRELIATGKLPATSRCSHQHEMKAALRHVWDIARALWSAHPANASRVSTVTVSPFGRQHEGVRPSAF